MKASGIFLMGAHKQRWTAEEEAALKAGVVKHGVGKWRTILTDPEFTTTLRLRSNVDLKDKWRNINVMANGLGSRHKGRLSHKRNKTTSKGDENPLALSNVLRPDEEIVDARPLAISTGALRIAGSKEPIKRLENLILEAITHMKEPGGSDKHAIALYIEEHYCAPLNFKKLLSTKLKFLTANGKLIKAKRRYRIAPNLTPEVRGSSSLVRLEGRQKNSSRGERSDMNRLAQCTSMNNVNKSQRDAKVLKRKSMSAQEAAEAAARAVAEAEAAIAAAEEAARVAEEAEAEAEAAKIFAEAAMSALKCRTVAT